VAVEVPPPRQEAPTSPSPKVDRQVDVVRGEGPEFKYEITEIPKQPPMPSKRNALLVENTDLESGTMATEKWTIFAWAIREVLSKASGLPLSEQQQREKLEFEEQLGYYKPRAKKTPSVKPPTSTVQS